MRHAANLGCLERIELGTTRATFAEPVWSDNLFRVNINTTSPQELSNSVAKEL